MIIWFLRICIEKFDINSKINICDTSDMLTEDEVNLRRSFSAGSFRSGIKSDKINGINKIITEDFRNIIVDFEIGATIQ